MSRLIPSLVRFRPDVLFVTANKSYWFMLCFLPWLGITILPSFHGTPWPKFGRRKLSSRILWQLNRFMLLKYLKVMVVTSNDIPR